MKILYTKQMRNSHMNLITFWESGTTTPWLQQFPRGPNVQKKWTSRGEAPAPAPATLQKCDPPSSLPTSGDPWGPPGSPNGVKNGPLEVGGQHVFPCLPVEVRGADRTPRYTRSSSLYVCTSLGPFVFVSLAVVSLRSWVTSRLRADDNAAMFGGTKTGSPQTGSPEKSRIGFFNPNWGCWAPGP